MTDKLPDTFDLRQIHALIEKALSWKAEREKAIDARPDGDDDKDAAEYWQVRHQEQIAIEQQHKYESMIGDYIVEYVAHILEAENH